MEGAIISMFPYFSTAALVLISLAINVNIVDIYFVLSLAMSSLTSGLMSHASAIGIHRSRIILKAELLSTWIKQQASLECSELSH